MLPFARIVQYGNVAAPPVKIKKVVGGTNSAFILYDDGRLFGAGSNSNGELNIGNYTGWNGATPRWILSQSNVDNVWSGPFAYGVVTQIGTEFYYTGNAQARNLNSGTYYYSPSNLNLSTSIGTTDYTVLDVRVTLYSIHFLIRMSDGSTRIYGCGRGNKLGRNDSTGSTGSISLVQSTSVIGTNIVKIDSNMNAFYYLTASGDLYGTGVNVSNQLSTSAVSTIYLTYQLQSNNVVKTFSVGTDNYIAQSGIALYCRGNNSLNAISEITSATTIPTYSITSSGGSTLSSSSCQLVSSNYSSAFINYNQVAYAIGNIGGIFSSTVGRVSSYTNVLSSVTDFSNFSTSYNNAFWGNDDSWYMTTSTSGNGIVGVLQPNGTYKLPVNL